MKDWRTHMGSFSGIQALTTYDHGVRSVVNELPQPDHIILMVHLRAPDDMGLMPPKGKEATRIKALINAVETLLETSGGRYLGHVFHTGKVMLCALIPADKKQLVREANGLCRASGYPPRIMVARDPRRDVYWKLLHVDPVRLQATQDADLLHALMTHGDDPEQKRDVHHHAYFPDHASAVHLTQWLDANGYTSVMMETGGDEFGPNRWHVRFTHSGTTQPKDIHDHTRRLTTRISELGGEYDGWETMVMRTEDSRSS